MRCTALRSLLLLCLPPCAMAVDLSGKTTLGETWYWSEGQEYLASPTPAKQPQQTQWFWQHRHEIQTQPLIAGVAITLPFGLAISSSLHQWLAAPHQQMIWQLGSTYGFTPALQLHAHYRLQSPSPLRSGESQPQMDLGLLYRF